MSGSEKPVFVGSSQEVLRALPKPVRLTFGRAIRFAEQGGKHPAAKPLRGFGGAGVLEIVEDDRGSTYRAVYTVRLAGLVYVLHVFQKKSKVGAKTPRHEIEIVRKRLKEAEELHAEWKRRKGSVEGPSD